MSAKAFPGLAVRWVLTLAVAAGLAVAGWKLYEELSASAAVPEAGAPGDAVQRATQPGAIGALGRLEPKDGLRRVPGPSRPTVVIGELRVEEGDRVSLGQALAVLDDFAVLESRVVRLRARLENAEEEYGRYDKLYQNNAESVSLRNKWRMQVDVAKADLQSAQAELGLATVRSPIDGQVVKIHARRGERVGPDGVVEIGATDDMYAVAEVYETDIGRVRVGQRATVSSPAFPGAIHGTVERIGLKVTRQDVLHTDPAVETDARVVEVKVRLDESRQVSGLTNLETEVIITP